MINNSKQTYNSLLKWVDKNILLLLSSVLIAFIPLYPKIPLADLIPGYIVRARLEDVLVLITFVIWLVQAYRKKAAFNKTVFIFVALYSVFGILSIVSGVLLIDTIPAELLHIGKSSLHLFRYFEYFTLLFIVYSSVKTKKDVYLLLTIFVTTVMVVSIYGFGQKYYYWPVYSTMNREFSKGVRLVLTEHARVQSTFGGHYDLAAFLVIALPIILAWLFSATKRFVRICLLIIFAMGVTILVLSASRISFASYLAASSFVVVLFGTKKQKWWKKIWWTTSRFLMIMVLTFIIIANFGSSLYERFLQVIELSPFIHDTYHALNHQKKYLAHTYIPAKLGFIEMPKAKRPKNAVDIDSVLVSSDERPVPADAPPDVYVNVPDIIEVATVSADGTKTTTTIERDRTYSPLAQKYGLSLAIRLDTLWPKAIEGFSRNPLVGSGYATLNKDGKYHFTEAESTDNNFLRTLGETGLLGFITFYGCVVIATRYAFKSFLGKDPLGITLGIGFMGATVGLLINATYIDVFAASKVAFTYWSITGLLLGYHFITTTQAQKAIETSSPTTELSANKKASKKTEKKRVSSSKKSMKRKIKSKSSKKTKKNKS